MRYGIKDYWVDSVECEPNIYDCSRRQKLVSHFSAKQDIDICIIMQPIPSGNSLPPLFQKIYELNKVAIEDMIAY